MDIDEIKNYTANGKVCIDISVLPKYSGFVRKIIFYSQYRVCIEFVGYTVDESESGYEFCNTFLSLEDAIANIESYLDKPIENWTNHTKTGEFPELELPINIKKGHRQLCEDIINKKIFIPENEYFKPNFDLSIL